MMGKSSCFLQCFGAGHCDLGLSSRATAKCAAVVPPCLSDRPTLHSTKSGNSGRELANRNDSVTKKQKVMMRKVTCRFNLSEIIEEITHCGNADIELSVNFLTSVRKVVMMKDIRMS